MNLEDYKTRLLASETDLIEHFGRQRLEETAFPVYFNKFQPAAYLGWERVRAAQKLLKGCDGTSALDFGSGLGVMFPFLAQHYQKIVACDLDIEITKFIA